MKRSGLGASAGCSNSIMIDNVSSDIETIQPTRPLFQRTGFWRCMKTAKTASGLVLQMEELRESAHRLVIRVHLAEGNVGEARRQSERCRRILHKELGIHPSEQLRDLIAGQYSPRRP